jgi:pyruvate ferredoxin oxidoreductase gamma subunit
MLGNVTRTRGVGVDLNQDDWRRASENDPVMFQIRIHGRGGQGVVSGAELLSVAAFHEGRYAQAFPSFGSERMGAPVMAFCRIDERPIRLREPVLDPDALIIQDPTLLHQVDLFNGVRAGAYVLINSTRGVEEMGLADVARGARRFRFVPVPATDLARKHVGRAVPNVPLLGAFAAVTGVIGIDSLVRAIEEKFPPPVAARNVAAAREAFAMAKTAEAAHA